LTSGKRSRLAYSCGRKSL